MKKILNYQSISFPYNSQSAFFGLQVIAIALAFPLFSYLELAHWQTKPLNPAALLKNERAIQDQKETAVSFQQTINSTNF